MVLELKVSHAMGDLTNIMEVWLSNLRALTNWMTWELLTDYWSSRSFQGKLLRKSTKSDLIHLNTQADLALSSISFASIKRLASTLLSRPNTSALLALSRKKYYHSHQIMKIIKTNSGRLGDVTIIMQHNHGYRWVEKKNNYTI